MLKRTKEKKTPNIKPIKEKDTLGFSFKVKNNKNAPGNTVVTVSRERLVMGNGERL